MNLITASSNPSRKMRRQRGMLMAELNAAMGILMLVVLSMATPLAWDRNVIRENTRRAAAMEIVDGETEILMAGAWRAFGSGVHDYPIAYESARTLPKGRFVLVVEERKVTLEWRLQLESGREAVRTSRSFVRD